jgi:SAM-dependent methyltransferase
MRRALAAPPAGVDPWFLRYCGDLAGDRGALTYARAKWQLVSLAGGVRGKVVVDAGSGFGMVANLLACWGAARVHAVEVHTPMVESHHRILARDFPFLRNVHPIRGDASHLPLRGRTADLVLSIEAISHYFDVGAFLDECARVLRPGGVLLVSDGNNGANPAVRARNDELWERLENGPHGPVEGHDVQETHVERRERVIRERFPDLAPVETRAYAETTAGFDRVQIEAAILAHRGGGPAPASRYRRGELPRDPEWGYVVERLFDPRELRRDLEARGFRVAALPHFGGARNDLVEAANRVLRRLPTFRFAPAFRIVATRT